MRVQLGLKYSLKEGEQVQFLEADEVDALNREIAAAVEKTPDLTQARAAVLMREVRQAFLANVGGIEPRVSGFLIRKAVGFKFGDKMPRKDGKTWGRIVEMLDEHQVAVALSPADAVWLTDVWFDEKAQNGFEPGLQRWMNVLEGELEAVRDALKSDTAQVAG